jgi:uncharacterized secreted repeat protein (TIGR03808 family)
MALDRRSMLGLSAGGIASAAIPTPGRATPMPLGSLGLDVTHFGVNAGSPDDQSAPLQRAIDASAEARVPLWLPAGTYIAADLTLPSGAQIYGIRGATRLMLGHGASIVASARADQVTLQGLVFDGRREFLPKDRGLISLRHTRGVRILDCIVQESGGDGILLEGIEGEVAHSTVIGAAHAAIRSIDARGLVIAQNTILNAGNGGILVWRSQAGDDGTQVLANRIENVEARAGGTGENGNGINVFRAANVIVADNRLKNCAFSAVRGNSASNLHVRGNAVTNVGEVAIFSEFAFEGAVIANNGIDGAAIGVSITNLHQYGGRLAVCHGNIVRNIVRTGTKQEDREARGIGIHAEADTAVTGNVVENAEAIGIRVGFGVGLRDVSVTGNVVRVCPIGIAISVAPGAGSAMVANNLIADAARGAVLGMEWYKPVTGDLARGAESRHAQITVNGNRVR